MTLTQHLIKVVRMMKCERLSIDDLSRHAPIYRNGNFRKMRPQFRKLLFRKLKTQQRTFNNAKVRSKLQNWDLFFEVVSNDAGFVALILLQALTFTKKKKKIVFNSTLQSGRNMVSQLALTYSLIAVVSYETNLFFVYRHSAQIVFVV